MGYNTQFDGIFRITPPLKPEHKEYLYAFSYSRRVRWTTERLAESPDPVRVAAKLPLGNHGCYFVDHVYSDPREPNDPSVLDYNLSPDEQPTLWCNWCPTDDGTELVWNEAENVYLYDEWIVYLIEHFLDPWGYVLNGEVEWHGQDEWDTGIISIINKECRGLRKAVNILFPALKSRTRGWKRAEKRGERSWKKSQN